MRDITKEKDDISKHFDMEDLENRVTQCCVKIIFKYLDKDTR